MITVKEVIDTAAALLRLDKVTEKETEDLLRCFNLVYTEIACDYIPLTTSEETESGGMIYYTALRKAPFQILKVESGGRKYDFETFASYFTAPVGRVTVTYNYLPEEAVLTDDIEYGARLTPAVFAYGTASEYSLLNCEFEESQMWDKRYRDALASACRERREIKVKKRGWY